MINSFEEFILGGNIAHDLHGFKREGNSWNLEVAPCNSYDDIKVFIFENAVLEYEQLLTENDESLDFPLPLIGLEYRKSKDKNWRFLINASDAEWAFLSEWPIKT